MDASDVAWLVFRESYSFVFLNAAWKCGKDKAGIEWTIAESRILFGDAAKVFGPAGIFVMGAGGISILLGLWAEVGGSVLAGFVLMGAVIHLRNQNRAIVLAKAVQDTLGGQKCDPLDELALNAQLGRSQFGYEKPVAVRARGILRRHGFGTVQHGAALELGGQLR